MTKTVTMVIIFQRRFCISTRCLGRDDGLLTLITADSGLRHLDTDAAFEIETELELLVHQPAGGFDAVMGGDDRVDAHASEDDEDGDDGDYFPAKILHINSMSRP